MRLMICALALLLTTVGCTKTAKYDVAVFEMSPGKITQPAPKTAKYNVKVELPGKEGFAKVPHLSVVVPQGTPMGFEQTEQGIIAFAGDQLLPLDVPAGSTLKWQAKFKKPTQFAKNMQRVGEFAGAATIVVGYIAVEAAVNEMTGDHDHDCADRNQRCKPSH